MLKMALKILDVALPDTRSALFVMRDTEAIETPAILATARTAPSASLAPASVLIVISP